MSKRHNVRNVAPKHFYTIERVWAERGIVKTQLKDGSIRNLTVREAALNAQQLNKMYPKLQDKKTADELLVLVDTITQACFEAKRQIANRSDNKLTDMLHNVLEGKTAEGKNPDEVEPFNVKIQRLAFMYTMLTVDEIGAILKDKYYTDNPQAGEMFIRTVNAQRIQQYSQKPIDPK